MARYSPFEDKAWLRRGGGVIYSSFSLLRTLLITGLIVYYVDILVTHRGPQIARGSLAATHRSTCIAFRSIARLSGYIRTSRSSRY